MPSRQSSFSPLPRIVACLFVFACANVAAKEPEELRQWRSTDGKSVLGRLITADDDKVTLDVKGKRYTLEIVRLSEADRAYVDTWTEKNPYRAGGATALADLPPWPQKYDGTGKVTVETVNEDEVVSTFAYCTEHYLFALDRKIPKRNLDEIAAVFESVSGALSAMPIERLHPAFGNERRFPTIFFSQKKDYERAGGPSGSVGVFDMRRQAILIRLDVLLTNENHGSNLPHRERYQVLVHELTHQAMYPAIVRMPIWYIEGVAEYMSAAHFATARFDFRNLARHIRKHIHRFVPADDNGAFTLPSIPSVYAMTSKEWNKDNVRSDRDATKKYATSLLLTHWFHHLHGDGKAQEIDAFLKGLAKRQKENEIALKTILADGETLAGIQQKIANYWSSQGLKLRFE